MKSREDILWTMKAVVGQNHGEDKVHTRVIFCPNCGNDISHSNLKPGQAITCPELGCGYAGDRAFIFDDKMMWTFNHGNYPTVPSGELVHFVVGAVIKREERYLLIRRTLYPIGQYTIPAGHLEQGESPERAMLREVYEETGLAVSSYELLIDDRVMVDKCRRSVDYHVWKLYLCECIGDPKMNYESDIIGWYTAHEIETLPLGPVTKEALSVIFDKIL